MLNAHDQATLLLHEAYYHAARQVHATTSDDTRRLIGLAMFGQTPEPVLKAFWNSTRHLTCVGGLQGVEDKELFGFAGRNEVYNGQQGVMLYAKILKSRVVAFRTTAFLPGTSIEEFEQSVSKKWLTQAKNDFSALDWNLELEFSTPTAKMRAWKDGDPLPIFSDGFCFVGQ
jgi:hypothetical protein